MEIRPLPYATLRDMMQRSDAVRKLAEVYIRQFYNPDEDVGVDPATTKSPRVQRSIL